MTKPKKSIKSSIYYAHPVSIYGTAQEERDVVILSGLGFEVCNPNTPESAQSYKELGFDYYTGLIDTCDVLAFRALPGGAIPAGVAKEIGHALESNMIAIEIPTFSLRKILTVDETRQYLTEIGER